MKYPNGLALVACLVGLLGCGSEVIGFTGAAGSGGAAAATSTVGAGGNAGSADAVSVGSTGGGGAKMWPPKYGPFTQEFAQYAPKWGSHCVGTNQQDIAAVEKVVFLGDSITVGTFPTPAGQTYRAVLTQTLQKKFGDSTEIASCAQNGAVVADLMTKQIPQCFPAPEPKRTLVVMTMGGNDVAGWAKKKLPADQADVQAQKTAAVMRTAVEWLKDAKNFPKGSFVMLANVYEYTDATGDLNSCPGAQFAGLSGNYVEGVTALVHLDEAYLKIAVDTKSDMVLMLESFCGHGYHSDDPANLCYRGPNAPRWFDVSCIHPTPAGHAALAGMFQSVVDE